ncbi:hypothetical protein C672_3627 [[Clostridium] bifermentans ATCC 638]|uniref:DUF2634 domain-containing protein n=1 Tax=Paraclostridium bifermentans ATCC 638 = DSM 14991 TaxID=1233171 RepID=T4VGD8_PARBF|nr:DUF2634 domain-containing protein [Paraclostridium bifermentans]EQK39831.1 hypothetical protein C672_3627 [[Clostridium] bifermentans ATCC 638] [Paraclostridium bifermentans ATCC 638 = DSM 14991]
MSLFPFIGTESVEIENKNNDLPPLKEIAIDFITGNPIVENKQFKVVEGIEALKVWIYRALKVERFVYDIYSWDFGSEMHTLRGKNYSQALTNEEVKRYAKEAILINPYINDVSVESISFEGSLLSISLKLDTVFGSSKFEI